MVCSFLKTEDGVILALKKSCNSEGIHQIFHRTNDFLYRDDLAFVFCWKRYKLIRMTSKTDFEKYWSKQIIDIFNSLFSR